MVGYLLVNLAHLTGETVWIERSGRQLRFLAQNVKDYPAGYSFTPVSYTHLDVYKRQVPRSQIKQIFTVTCQPVDRREMSGVSKALIQSPETADETFCILCNRF